MNAESYDHENGSGTEHVLIFIIHDQDMIHTKKIGDYMAKNGVRINTGAYPYIANYIYNKHIYIKSPIEHVNKNLISTVSFKTKDDREKAKLSIIDAFKEWSELQK